MNQKIGFLEEAPGVQSWMRLMCTIIVLNALFVMNYQIFTRPDHGFDMASVSFLLSIALGAKVWQKTKEIAGLPDPVAPLTP